LQASVDSDDLTSGFAESIGDQDEVGLRLISGSDWRSGQRAIRVKLRELIHE
jgi:hypothetical protein